MQRFHLPQRCFRQKGESLAWNVDKHCNLRSYSTIASWSKCFKQRPETSLKSTTTKSSHACSASSHMLRTEPWAIAARPQRLAAFRDSRKCKQSRSHYATAMASASSVLKDQSSPASTSNLNSASRRQQTITAIKKAQNVLSKPLPRSSAPLRTWTSALHKVQQRLNEDSSAERPSVASAFLYM